MKIIYIVSPAYIATGGTELLQQLCYVLNSTGKKCYMYYTEEYNDSDVEKKFKKYNNQAVERIPDNINSVIVIPETRIDFAYKFKSATIYFWWLSVDNYYGSRKLKTDIAHSIVYSFKDKRNQFLFKRNIHLVQSEYAKQYLLKEKNIDNKNIHYLSDYLNDTFLNNAMGDINSNLRKNQILYNPRKGLKFTEILIDNIVEYDWIPLQGLTPDEMLHLMQISKVYIDFGNHPGKDRIPREAAICGCCIITGKRGSANNKIDIAIKDKYKFEDRL